MWTGPEAADSTAGHLPTALFHHSSLLAAALGSAIACASRGIRLCLHCMLLFYASHVQHRWMLPIVLCAAISKLRVAASKHACASVCLSQELMHAHPHLVPGAVGDLSAGGALPLHLAAAGGCVDVVQALLAAGAPLEAKDGKGLTALQVGASPAHSTMCAVCGWWPAQCAAVTAVACGTSAVMPGGVGVLSMTTPCAWCCLGCRWRSGVSSVTWRRC